MKQLILWLPDIKFRHQYQYGSKAVNLGVVSREMKTPPGFCLSAAAYEETLKTARVFDQIIDSARQVESGELDAINRVSEEIEEIIVKMPVPGQVEEVLAESYEKLRAGRDDFLVAVRSSATAEDLPSASFAGQLESYLNIDSFPEMLQAVKKCWASLWTPRAIYYRFQKGIGQANIGMAVIIQEMVPAQSAGVMFTANPVTGSRKEFYIEAVSGLGEGLVLGEKNADRYIVEKERLLIKTKELVAAQPCLNDYHIKTLADYGAKLEFLYQLPQDIEWAFNRGEIFVLQTRPITTLEDEEPELFPEDQMTPIQRDIWININERFPEPVLPIDGIIAKIYYLSLFSAYRDLGFIVPYVDWHRVEEGLFPEFFVPPRIRTGPLRLLKLGKMLNWQIEEEWKINESSFDKYLKLLRDERLPGYPLEIIMEYVEDALRDFQRALTFRYLLYIQFGTAFHVLSRVLKLLYGVKGQELLDGLTAGEPQVTMELNQRLMHLALKAKMVEEVKNLIVQSSPEQLMDSLSVFPEGKDFLREFDDFLAEYGDRELSQGLGGLAVMTWREQPQVVWSMVRGILVSESDPVRLQENILERRREAEQKLEALGKQGVGRVLPVNSMIDKLVSLARSYNAFRENSHFYLTQAMTVFRTLFLEMGRRLVRRGLLDSEHDIMFLNFFEVKELLYVLYSQQKVSKLELAEKIHDRKEKQERRRKRWQNRKTVGVKEGSGVLRGVGTSSGIVSGPCRIITDPGEFSRLQPGDILVASYTNPSWTPVFSFIGGLVVEYGSTVSHAAIIAREYGIPAVMGVKGAVGVLREGETITVDGSRGLVERLGVFSKEQK